MIPERAIEIERKYNLKSTTISDIELGDLEGKIFAATFILFNLGAYHENELLTFLKNLAKIYGDKINLFIHKCYIKDPSIELPKSRASKLRTVNELATTELFPTVSDVMESIDFTLYGYGSMYGFLSATLWAMGKEPKNIMEYIDIPIDWQRFYEYLKSYDEESGKRSIAEVSEFFNVLCPRVHRWHF